MVWKVLDVALGNVAVLGGFRGEDGPFGAP